VYLLLDISNKNTSALYNVRGRYALQENVLPRVLKPRGGPVVLPNRLFWLQAESFRIGKRGMGSDSRIVSIKGNRNIVGREKGRYAARQTSFSDSITRTGALEYRVDIWVIG
jgi:hypothetical protein